MEDGSEEGRCEESETNEDGMGNEEVEDEAV